MKAFQFSFIPTLKFTSLVPSAAMSPNQPNNSSSRFFCLWNFRTQKLKNQKETLEGDEEWGDEKGIFNITQIIKKKTVLILIHLTRPFLLLF